MSTIIVFGAGGQLGHCLKLVAEQQHIQEVLFPDETEGNILDPVQLQVLFSKYKPAYCINCAAYTAVDKAEEEQEKASLVNKTGVGNIARLCKEFGTTMIHISTDFVFAGHEVKLLKESDPAAPINVYGATKLEGEQVLNSILPEHFILRTSWLYSEFGNNFVKTMLRLGADRDSLNVIADQAGTPTYAPDLARCIFSIISSGSTAYGTYHYSNEGVASWYDFAKAIFDLSGNNIKLGPIPTSAYPTPAKRPAFSVMDKSKIKQTFNIEIPYWRHSLEKCVANLVKD